MADAPEIRSLLEQVKGDIRRERDTKDEYRRLMDEANARLTELIARRDQYQTYLDWLVTQP